MSSRDYTEGVSGGFNLAALILLPALVVAEWVVHDWTILDLIATLRLIEVAIWPW